MPEQSANLDAVVMSGIIHEDTRSGTECNAKSGPGFVIGRRNGEHGGRTSATEQPRYRTSHRKVHQNIVVNIQCVSSELLLQQLGSLQTRVSNIPGLGAQVLKVPATTD